MVSFFEGQIDVEQDVANLPQGGTIYIQTDQELDIAWWDPNTQQFGPAQTFAVPGEEFSVPSWKARITTGATANIRIVSGI